MNPTPIPETVMNERCAGCAFRPGTQASTNPITSKVRDLCVMVGSPFECHDAGDGHLCRGFVDAFAVKVANGDYDRLPPWKKHLFASLLDVIHDCAELDARGEPYDADAMIRNAINQRSK